MRLILDNEDYRKPGAASPLFTMSHLEAWDGSRLQHWATNVMGYAGTMNVQDWKQYVSNYCAPWHECDYFDFPQTMPR